MRERRHLIPQRRRARHLHGRVEWLNSKVRLIRRAYGFHSADGASALVMLAAGPIELRLPHERPATTAAG
jgi:hypothetical protein